VTVTGGEPNTVGGADHTGGVELVGGGGGDGVDVRGGSSSLDDRSTGDTRRLEEGLGTDDVGGRGDGQGTDGSVGHEDEVVEETRG